MKAYDYGIWLYAKTNVWNDHPWWVFHKHKHIKLVELHFKSFKKLAQRLNLEFPKSKEVCCIIFLKNRGSVQDYHLEVKYAPQSQIMRVYGIGYLLNSIKDNKELVSFIEKVLPSRTLSLFQKGKYPTMCSFNFKKDQ